MAEPFRPQTAAELRDLIAWAAAEATSLELLGSGSKGGLGRPLEAEHRVQLDRMAGIGMYEPAELVMSAAAGTPLAEIEARLAASHQQLAFEPPDYGALLDGAANPGTIGAVFACNLAGPRRIKAGAARDHLLGVQAVTGRGDLIKSGGRVVKNVTGYDLCKLLAGSFGTLAAISEVTFKVLPAPEATATLVLAGHDRAACFRALRLAMGSSADVGGAAGLPAVAARRSAIAALDDAPGELALIRLEGPEPSVRVRSAALQSLIADQGATLRELDTGPSRELWREIRDVALLPAAASALWRVSIAPDAGPGLLTVLERQLTLEWLADWAGGLLWLAVPEADDAGAAVIRSILADAGGHATLIRGSLELRRRIDVFQPQPAPLARLTERVKDSFDPKRILNPGRMYAGF